MRWRHQCQQRNRVESAIADFNSQTAACSYTIALTGDIALTADTTPIDNATADVDLTIEGNGFKVDGQQIFGVRPFKIEEETNVVINDITITGGSTGGFPDPGGAIWNIGNLTLNRAVLDGNRTQ